MDETGRNPEERPMADSAYTEGSPFEEPEQAPELRQDRSDNVYSRQEPFWERVVDADGPGRTNARDPNYWNHQDVMDTDRMLHIDNDTGLQKVRKFLGSGVVRKCLLALAVLVVFGVIVYSALFQVRAIRVVGNTTIPEDVIIRLSGLKEGQNTLSIDDEAVMRRVDGNRYLHCTLVDVQWDTVTIHVKARTPVAYTDHNGMMLTLDNRGYVLEETLRDNAPAPGLVKVVGLDVHHANLGQQIVLLSEKKKETYTLILVELKAMQGLPLLAELDMTDMDSLRLGTCDDFSVRLGNEESIHEKLRAFLITREKLLEMGMGPGTIDVTNPVRPSFLAGEPENIPAGM